MEVRDDIRALRSVVDAVARDQALSVERRASMQRVRSNSSRSQVSSIAIITSDLRASRVGRGGAWSRRFSREAPYPTVPLREKQLWRAWCERASLRSWPRGRRPGAPRTRAPARSCGPASHELGLPRPRADPARCAGGSSADGNWRRRRPVAGRSGLAGRDHHKWDRGGRSPTSVRQVCA